jgi:iron(III) transport system permease protein
MAYGARLSKTTLANGSQSPGRLGYAVPGAVIAVGVLIPVTRLDNWLAGQWEHWFGTTPACCSPAASPR